MTILSDSIEHFFALNNFFFIQLLLIQYYFIIISINLFLI